MCNSVGRNDNYFAKARKLSILQTLLDIFINDKIIYVFSISIIPNGTASLSSLVLKHVSNQVIMCLSVSEVGGKERVLSERKRRERERKRERDRQTERYTDIHTDTHTDRQTDLIISRATELSTPSLHLYLQIQQNRRLVLTEND